MRLSRPCYDKYWRCPGWAGGGWRYARNVLCDNGRIQVDWENPRGWKWRFHHCDTCNVTVFPYKTRYLDPAWWVKTRVGLAILDWRADRKWRKERGKK